MSTRLIVKNLPASADENRLRAHFGSQGAVTDVRVLRKKDGSSRGFAFVGFKNEAQAECARKYFDRSCLGACKLSVEAAEAFKVASHEPPTAQHKAFADSASDLPRSTADQHPKGGRSSKLAEFLGLMKPQSKSQTFVNESGPIIDAGPGLVTAVEQDSQLQEAMHQAGVLAANVDPVVINDDISDLEYLKSRMRPSVTSGAAPRSTANDTPEGVSPKAPERDARLSNQDSTTVIRATGRLFVRNLAYTAVDEEIRTLMEDFGNLTECRILRSKAGTSKGKLSQFDKTTDQADGGQNRAFKAERAKERKANAGDQTSWSTFYMRDDTVAEAVADLLGITKAELLDPEAPDAAVRMALGETQVLAATKEDLSAAGVNVGVLESAAQHSRHAAAGHTVPRSNTVLLLKNLPFAATEDNIQELFERSGGCTRLVLPRTRALALVELPDELTATSAFRRLAYKRFQNVPLYLEFAPDGVFEKPAAPTSTKARVQPAVDKNLCEDDHNLEFAEPGQAQASSTLFIKGLSFGTTQDSLQRRCAQAAEAVGGLLRSVKMPMRSNSEGKAVMQGYAFAEFNDHSTARSVLQQLSGSNIDGHAIVVELSHTGPQDADRTTKKRARDGKAENKIMVRNLAFEATSKDVRQLMEAYGHVRTCRLPKKFDGSTRGFAFVEFATKGEALKAMNSAHGAHLYGRRLLLEYAKAEAGVDELRSKVSKGNMADE